ncbi:ArsR/SmtB family transcription factor [Leekyejoonella antrihumi]|uniref:Helix-turn-helix transcriptional regulator n=1 Tax=Leekyejoonella antrihumi TaxID=1660198 RepID=A0A563DU89_9MICO|nr:helix-turn-helix domain-containing protein [Leekyejoonella antrihumi]TWP33818.1 helix-turn-helix transcriptional regulator [Leekyejoonella antrihumi]
MTTQTAAEADECPVVGTLEDVLAALGDPVRLEMVRRMWGAGGPKPCGQLYAGVSKSTASHHFKVLREAGIVRTARINGKVHQELRKAELEAAFGPVLESVVRAANR